MARKQDQTVSPGRVVPAGHVSRTKKPVKSGTPPPVRVTRSAKPSAKVIPLDSTNAAARRIANDHAAKMPVRARGRQRVEKVVASTIELLRTHELGELTIMMIADHAAIGRSSVYEYFPTITAIIRVIAERYTAQVVANTHALLLELNSHALPDIVDRLIDGTIDFWNERPAAAKIHLGSDASFSLRVMVKDFHRAGASVYHEWYKPGWAMAPLAEDDPFRTLSVLQYALFSESVQRHGCITDYFRRQVKLIAHAYLSHYTSAITRVTPR